MRRLIAFGCSHTFGHFLPIPGKKGYSFQHLDIWSEPSSLSWPSLLTNKLKFDECVNAGQCGASNIEILNKLLLFEYTEHDEIFVLWTHLERETIFNENKKLIYRINSSKKDFPEWIRIRNNYDIAVKAAMCIHHAKIYLESKNLKFSFYSVDENFLGYKEYIINQFKLNIKPIYFHEILNTYPKALDNYHPGVEAHERIAELMYLSR